MRRIDRTSRRAIMCLTGTLALFLAARTSTAQCLTCYHFPWTPGPPSSGECAFLPGNYGTSACSDEGQLCSLPMSIDCQNFYATASYVTLSYRDQTTPRARRTAMIQPYKAGRGRMRQGRSLARDPEGRRRS
jgi:hypothetical protein